MKAAVVWVSTVDEWEPSTKSTEISEIKMLLHRWDKTESWQILRILEKWKILNIQTYFTFVSGDFLAKNFMELYNTNPGKGDDSKICREKYFWKRRNYQEDFYIYFHFHYLLKWTVRQCNFWQFSSFLLAFNIYIGYKYNFLYISG